MFGRKNHDDEDYIAPVEEYRDECTDEHGITYDNYNSEQDEADREREVHDRFRSALKPGEQILRCGTSVKGAKLHEKGSGIIGYIVPAVIALIIFINVLPLLFVGGAFTISAVLFMVFAIFIVIRSMKGTKHEYAITDQRIITFVGGSYNAVPIDELFNITFYASDRNVGYIKYQRVYAFANGSNRVAYGGLYGVKDPEDICRLLIDTSAKLRQEKMNKQNNK